MKPEELAKEPALARSYAAHFAVLGMLFLGCFIWSVWDETVGRRPWKRYQAEFRNLEEYLLEEELDTARGELDQQQLEEVKRVQEKTLRDFSENQEVIDLRKLLQENEERLYEAQQLFQRARSKYQEAEYWKEKTGAEWADNKLAELAPVVQRRRATYDDLTKEKTKMRDKLKELGKKKQQVEERLRKLVQPVERIERRLKAARERSTKIRQIYLPELDVVDRCESCHLGLRDSRFADAIQPHTTHPQVFSLWRAAEGNGEFSWKGILDIHPPKRFGCTTCHQGQGYATTSAEKAHGHEHHWLTPMRKGEFIQASCLKCHQDVEGLPGAEVLAEGKRLFDRYACHNCHIAKGYEDSRKIAPTLNIIGSKVNRKWLVDWLKRPKDYLPKTVMPDFLLSDKEVEHIADFLMTLRAKETPEETVTWPSWAEKPFDKMTPKEEDAYFALSPDPMDAGEGVWSTARCTICHPRAGKGGATGLCPDLGNIVSKVNRNWLYKWIRHPKVLNPNTQMPHFRFTGRQLRNLVEYIVRSEEFGAPIEGEYPALKKSFPYDPPDRPEEVASVEEGKRLIGYYQCNGCHTIPGFPDKLRLCVELSYHGSKPIEELDFGRKQEKIPHTREAWFMEKLRDPRGFRDGLKMPDFGFSEEQLKAIAVLLVGNIREVVPENHRVPAPKHPYVPAAEFGSVVADVNCFACHRINGRGGTFAPDLTGEGSKVRRKWLRAFFKHPDVLRPILKQMPHFQLTDQEVDILTEHVKVALVDPGIPHNFLPHEPTPGEIAQGKKLYHQKGCHACHQIGAEGGAVGPVLSDAGDRLENGYIYAYLMNPRRFRPDAPEPDYGLSKEEATLLTKFLSSLKETKTGMEEGNQEDKANRDAVEGAAGAISVNDRGAPDGSDEEK